MNEPAIRLGWAGHGAKPAVAHDEFPCEGGDDRNLCRGETLHRPVGIVGVQSGMVSYESRVVDSGIGLAAVVSGALSTELYKHGCESVPRAVHRRVKSAAGYGVCGSVVGVRLGPFKAIDGGRHTRFGVSAGDT